MGPTGEDGEADERAGSVCAGDAPGGRAAPVPLIPPVPLDLHWAADGPPPVCVIPRLRAPPSAFRWGAGGPGTGRRVAPPARTSSGSNAADRAVNRRANTPFPARRRTRRRAPVRPCDQGRGRRMAPMKGRRGAIPAPMRRVRRGPPGFMDLRHLESAGRGGYWVRPDSWICACRMMPPSLACCRGLEQHWNRNRSGGVSTGPKKIFTQLEKRLSKLEDGNGIQTTRSHHKEAADTEQIKEVKDDADI